MAEILADLDEMLGNRSCHLEQLYGQERSQASEAALRWQRAAASVLSAVAQAAPAVLAAALLRQGGSSS